MKSSVLALSLGLVGREMGLGCMLGTCFCGSVCLVFCPCSVRKFGFSRLTSCFPASGGDLAYGASGQCVPLCLIDAWGVQLPA